MKIQLKRSNVLEAGKAKKPTAQQTEYGEICVNYSSSDPTLFIKDSNNQIVAVAGARVIEDQLQGENYLKAGDNVTLLVNNAGYVTAADLNNGGYLKSGDNISELTNDAGYLTADDIPELPEISQHWEDDDNGNLVPKDLTNRVGIGTATPQATLEVAGDLIATSFRIDLLETLV